MRGFEVDGASPSEFVRRVESALTESGLDGHTEIYLQDNDLVVRVRWMGTTELRYRISETDDGFRAQSAGQRVSPFHSAFRHAFDDRFDQILQKVGARPVPVQFSG